MADDQPLGASFVDLLRRGAQGIVGGINTAGQYLGIPQADVTNASGDVVFPTNALERGLQSSDEAANQYAAAFIAPGAKTPLGEAAAQTIKPIRAFHGSPYDFDRFDLGKIGSGEGAQAYGHGLYFAEAEPTAESYIGNQARWKYGRTNAQTIYDRLNDQANERGLDNAGWSDLNAKRGFWEKVVLGRSPRGMIENAKFEPEQYGPNELAYMQSLDPTRFTRKGGHMYEVSINADPQQFLQWDQPLKDQPVAETVARMVPGDLRKPFDANVASGITGGNAYMNYIPSQSFAVRSAVDQPFGPSNAKTFEEALQSVGGDPKLVRTILNPDRAQASATLQEGGVPGIRYFDQGSRAAQQGTSNYVVFDPKIIDILRKYGIAGALGSSVLTDQLRQQGEQ